MMIYLDSKQTICYPFEEVAQEQNGDWLRLKAKNMLPFREVAQELKANNITNMELSGGSPILSHLSSPTSRPS